MSAFSLRHGYRTRFVLSWLVVVFSVLSLSGCVVLDYFSRSGPEAAQTETSPDTSPETSSAAQAGDQEAARAQTEAWIQGLTGLSPTAQAAQAELAWRDPARPQLLRDRAAFLLATRPSFQSLAAQQHLSNLYLAAALSVRADMERLLTADLLTADAETLRALGGSVPRVQESLFPWSLTVWHAAQRQLLPNSEQALQRLADPSLYADPTLIGLPPPAPIVASGTPLLYSGKAALLLPLSGSFSTVGKQVAAGAQVAARVLARQGVHMDVAIIDSEGPAWQSEITALPPDCVVVGGPLRAETYNAAKSGLAGRALFAFLPLFPDPAEEGSLAWRFFTSPRDQIDAVLDFTVGALGIYSYGALAPSDPYGQRMTDYFLQAAAARGVRVSTASYTPGDMGAWTSVTGKFVQTVATERGKLPVARADFGAVFLPDSWKSMDMLISSLHYHGAYKMVMMGTSLWEQGLANASGLNTTTYAQTVFPGVWNARAAGAAAVNFQNGMTERGATPDDWAVLGFDFVQFAAALNLSTPPLNPAELNAKLAAGLPLDWAGAPMTWDAQGRGFRRLHLFQPSREGMLPLDREAFVAYRDGKGRPPNVEPGESANVAGDPSADSSADAARLEPDLDALVDSVLSGGASAP